MGRQSTRIRNWSLTCIYIWTISKTISASYFYTQSTLTIPSNICRINMCQSRLPTASNYPDLIVYLMITSWNHMINYGTPAESLRRSIGKFKDILNYRRNNGNLRNKACKMLKSNKNSSITASTKISISELVMRFYYIQRTLRPVDHQKNLMLNT